MSEKSCTSCPNWGEKGGGLVIWTKSKRTAVLPRESVPYLLILSKTETRVLVYGIVGPMGSSSNIYHIMFELTHFQRIVCISL